MTQYLYQGKLTAKAGSGPALAEILVQASRLVHTAPGCRLYAVGQAAGQPEAVFITEIWDSKADHDASLTLPAVRALIQQALPILDGPPAGGLELEILGETGIH